MQFIPSVGTGALCMAGVRRVSEGERESCLVGTGAENFLKDFANVRCFTHLASISLSVSALRPMVCRLHLLKSTKCAFHTVK